MFLSVSQRGLAVGQTTDWLEKNKAICGETVFPVFWITSADSLI